MIPLLVNEREIEQTVIKKENDYISFKIGNVHFIDIMNFRGDASSVDSLLKTYKTSGTKGFFPYEWFDSPKKLTYPNFPSHNEFFNRLRNRNPLDKAHSDYQNFVNSGCSSEEALKKHQVSSIPPTGQENYAFLQQVWKNHDMLSFKDFIRWYNNKDVVPTLEATKKMIDFYYSKRIDMLNMDCTLPSLANICLHSSTNVKFYPFPPRYKDLLSIVGIGASQLYPYAMCQPMPTWLYTRWEINANLKRFKPRSKKTR